MARLLTIDACTVGLRNSLLGSLRPQDEGLLLPQASQSVDSKTFKNCIFRLSGGDGGLNAAVFSPDWFSGVSLVQLLPVDTAQLEKKLENPQSRAALLKALVDAIPSELADSSLQVGPPLEGDEFDRDKEGVQWTAGFDSPTAFVGIYTAEHSRAPEAGKMGMNRVHKEYFLVCRAGGGIAASTFHARVLAACSKGLSLDQMFAEGGALGPQALRRVASSAARNRHRILVLASTALGLVGVQTVGDQAGRNVCRGAVVDVDVTLNTLRKLDDVLSSTWQFTAALDGLLSKGLIALSNVSDGLVLFLQESSGEKKISLKNEVWNAIPLTTMRIAASRDLLARVMEASDHGDAEWIKKRFGWKNRNFKASQRDVIPFSLWGSHDTEQFTKSFTRELGISDLNAVRLRPEVVCLGGVEPGKLRAIVTSKS